MHCTAEKVKETENKLYMCCRPTKVFREGLESIEQSRYAGPALS